MTLWPDRETSALPTRAYLRSVLEQTLPARQAALDDSIEHFDEAASSDDRGWADLALAGVMADALQVLEDLAYVGESFTINRFGGLPFYVGAITYDGTVPTRFYERRRTDEDLRVLAGYSVRNPATGETRTLHEVLGRGLSPDARSAWREAEDITISVLRAELNGLSDVWKRFGRYFHAFKHGGLIANRADYTLLDDDGGEADPAIAVWLRRKLEPSAHGDASAGVQVDRVVRELQIRVGMAFGLFDLIISPRLGLAEYASTHAPGDDPDEVLSLALPVRFRLGPQEISPSAKAELEALGISFLRQDQSAPE